MASVLAVVAGSPAQAANTSSEALVDTNDDGVPDAREFGGRDRYDTALRLANNFGKAKGLGGVPTAFVASGHTLVDAVSVSGLAGFLDAPVMLTHTDSLHGGVADFIEDYGIDTIYVLGGSAAIADSVVEDMEALANSPTVTRISGDDRYATAAAIASKLGGGAAWCGGEDAAAILVNGGDVSLAEAMMVGPIAHRLQLPVLMTAADDLPMATSDFIESEDIEHVVIVGGTDGVSEDVADAVSDAGVDTVERIAGDTAAATSVALAGLLTGDCKDDLGSTSGDTVALVNRDALPDGIAAAPVLSSTYAGGSLVPILVVGDTLPASVRDYLAATPAATAAGKLNLSIVAIGGTAAVSDSVMQAALAAAASADELSVAIGNGGTPDADPQSEDRTDVNDDGEYNADDAPQVGDTAITLYFSDIIIADNTAASPPVTPLTNAIRDILEINGAPARVASVTRGTTGTRTACDPSQATVVLASPLRAGDTVSVVAGAKLGASGDQRTVGAASLTVVASAPDRARPTVSVVAIAGQRYGYVTITEANPGTATAATLEDTEVTVRSSAGTERTVTVLTSASDPGGVGDIDLGSGNTFAVGDRVTIAAGALTDRSGNKNLQRSFTAIRAQASPRITSVLMSNPNHSDQAKVVVPIVLTAGTGVSPAVAADAPDMRIEAKADGAAAGALGNGWSFTFDRASTYSAAKDLDIEVRVNSRDRNVSVRFNNGKAKFADLKAALEANSAFDALFEVKVDTDPVSISGPNAGACGMPANNDLAIASLVRGGAASTATLSGGMTKFAIQVTFNGYVMRVGDSNSEHVELAADILAPTVARVKGKGTNISGDTVVAADESPAEALTRVRGKLGWRTFQNTPDVDSDFDNYVFAMPSTMVRYHVMTSDASVLPQVRDLVTTAAGRDDDADTGGVDESVAPVAVGYATDVPTTAAKEDENAASQVRIGQSSSVKAPS